MAFQLDLRDANSRQDWIMKYSTKSGKLDGLRTDCLIVTMRIARTVARALDLDDYLVASSHDFVDKPGRTQLITLPKATRIRRVLLVGIGDDAELTPADFRKAVGAAAGVLKGSPVRDAVLAIDAFEVAGCDAYQKSRVALALLTVQLYRFAASKQQDETPPTQRNSRFTASRAARLPPTLCVTHRRSTPEWRSRAISAISRRTSATRRFSHPKRENYRAARPRRIACA